MASSSYAHDVESTPSFFKIIVNSHAPDLQNCDIPLNFAREYEDIFDTKKICLKVKGGIEWKVKLKKSNGRVRFDKGWEQFSKFYSLEYGHLLVFQYEGNFCFSVTIYEKSCSEIIYPIPAQRDSDEDCRIEDDIFWFENVFEDGKMEEEDEKMSRRKYKNTQTLPSRAGKTKSEGKGRALICSRDDFRGKELMVPNMKSQSVMKPKKKTYFGRISERATNLISMATNPSFSVTMGSSYIPKDLGRSYLNIPIAFAKIYLKESQEITLQVSNGRIWRLWCGVRSLEDRFKVEMRNGWREFVKDNNLRVGDVCVFELMETTPQVSFKVTIS